MSFAVINIHEETKARLKKLSCASGVSLALFLDRLVDGYEVQQEQEGNEKLRVERVLKNVLHVVEEKFKGMVNVGIENCISACTQLVLEEVKREAAYKPWLSTGESADLKDLPEDEPGDDAALHCNGVVHG